MCADRMQYRVGREGKMMSNESTFAMVKPDAFELRVVGRVLTRVEDEKFTIRQARQLRLTRDEAERFYAEHVGRPFFESLVAFMTSGPCLALLLERESAVKHWREVMGATDSRRAVFDSLRGRHGDKTGLAVWRNVVHGSDSPEAVTRESAFFFPSIDLRALAEISDTVYQCRHCGQWYTNCIGSGQCGPCSSENKQHDWYEVSPEIKVRLKAGG